MAADTGDSAGEVQRFILLSDIAGSSRLAEALPQQYHAALKRHNALTERAVASHGGSVYKQTGDGHIALFETAGACLTCARELAEGFAKFEPLAGDELLLVRIALHGGELRPVGAEYFGPALNRASRICQVCHPGQVLLSGAVADGAGVPPGGAALLDLGLHHLRDLAEPEHLYQLDDERFARREFPPLPTLNNRPNNLLQQPNLFVGRERELAGLSQLLLDSQRLVTIAAPGGYGKSRLAAQLCADLLPRFERGVFFVELAPLTEHTRIVYELANATGFQFYGSRDPQEQLTDYLREKELLLCFDNFEHVLPGAPLVSEIIKAAPRVKIVITSREPLRITGEQVYALQPLQVQVGGAGVSARDPSLAGTEARPTEAALLFADRAALVNPGFKLDAASSLLIEQVCAKLEGVPLSIELAAAWTDSFTLPELLAELSQQLELAARLSDVPERHRSVRASLDWSWSLLTGEQRQTLMALSTFRGGCFIDAASAVLDMKGMELRQALAALADKSWLFSRPVDGQTRFFIRDMASHEYAFEKLRETGTGRGDAVHRRASEQGRSMASPLREDTLYEQAVMAHARYFSALMEREGPKLHGHGQLEALSAIRLELLNIYETLDILQNRLPGDGAFLSGRARVPAPQPSSLAGAEARSTENYDADELVELLRPIARWLGQYLEMTSEFRVMLERYQGLKDAAGQASCLRPLLLQAMVGCGWAQQRLSAYEAARAELAEARKTAEALCDRIAVAYSLQALGNIEFEQGDSSAAHELFAEALAVRREIGYRTGIAASLDNLGLVERMQGNYGAARKLHAESLTIRREIGDRYGIAYSLDNLGNVERTQGNYGAARELFAEALAIRREIGDRRGIAASLGNLGLVEYSQGNYGAARELFAESLAIKREIGDRRGIAASLNNLGLVERMQGNYGAARKLHAESLAIRREIGDRYGIAYSLDNLGNVERTQGNYGAARELFAEALAIKREIGDQEGMCHSLAVTGCLLASREQHQAAAVCLYGARHYAAKLGYTFEPTERELLEQGLAITEHPDTGLPPADRERLKAQAEAMSLDDLAQFAQGELEKLKDILGAAEQQAGA